MIKKINMLLRQVDSMALDPWIVEGTKQARLVTQLGLILGVIIGFIICSLIGCNDTKTDGPLATYDSLGCIIVDMNVGEGEYRESKHTRVTNVKTVLIYAPRIRLYAEMDSREMSSIVTDEWWYNHHVGDSIYFNYILRNRFFPINR